MSASEAYREGKNLHLQPTVSLFCPPLLNLGSEFFLESNLGKKKKKKFFNQKNDYLIKHQICK